MIRQYTIDRYWILLVKDFKKPSLLVTLKVEKQPETTVFFLQDNYGVKVKQACHCVTTNKPNNNIFECTIWCITLIKLERECACDYLQ